MQQKVSIATDKSSYYGKWGGGGLINFSHIAPSPVAWEATVPMNYLEFVNGAAGKHSLAPAVLHRGQPVAQQFHDCGYLIQHMSLMGDPGVAPLQSSRVVVFGAGLVQIEQVAVGFAIFGDPQTPMLTCGKIPVPVAASDDSPANSVVVGMDPDWDYQCGWDHVQLLMFRALVGTVKDAAELIGTILSAGTAAVGKMLVDIGADVLKGVLMETVGQMLGDSLSARDVGRRYQERMQRRRAAGETDFASAQATEGARGMAEGGGEVIAGPIGGLGVGPASDYLFGTGPEEPEY